MQSFVTEQRNALSVHALPTCKYMNRYIHLSIVNERGRIPAAAFSVILRLLFNYSRGGLANRHTQQQLWSLYADQLTCDVEFKGDTQIASIRLRLPDGTLSHAGERTKESIELLAHLLFGPAVNGRFDYDETQYEEELAWVEHHTGCRTSDWDHVVRERCLSWLGYVEHSIEAELSELRRCIHDGELYPWYRELLRCPMHIHVIGDCIPEAMTAHIFATFPILEDTARKEVPLFATSQGTPLSRKEDGEFMLELMDIQQSKLNVAFTTGIEYGSAAYPALFLFHSVFGATPASRLQLGLRERKQWVYQIYSTLDDYRGALHVTTGTSSGRVTDVLEEIDAEWMRLCNGDIPEHELHRAIQNIIHYVQVGYDLPDQVVSLHMDRLLHGVQMTTPQFLEAISDTSSKQVAEVASGMKKEVTWILFPKHEYSA
ncbi:M16 family metallopeptidase [Paenibacillus illinoisensis]|uniref:M16 family metallopeptidase n=1 Tax=Paenibacillus illinoisensis TaxID=59845 RepID=UPI00301BE8DE